MRQNVIQQTIADGMQNSITEVTIFTNEAYVQRRVVSNTQVGLNRIFIELNAFAIDGNSVQAKVYSNGEILGVQYKEVPVLAEEIRQTDISVLRSEQKELEQQKRMLEYKQRNCLHQKQFLDAMVNFSCPHTPTVAPTQGKKQTTSMYSSVDELKAMLKNTESMLALLSHNYMAILQEEDGYVSELQTINERLMVIKSKLDLAVPNVVDTHKTIEVLFNTKTAEEIQIDASYVVIYAAWNPFYKVDVDANLNKIAITMFARIEQTTGENWQGVRLSLSNAVPIVSTRLPELHSIRISTDSSSHNQRYATGLATKSEPSDETSFLADNTDLDSVFDMSADSEETTTVDPVAEADVYIAYGRYEQAQQLLQQVLTKDPSNVACKAKLAEIAAILNPSSTAAKNTVSNAPKEAKFNQAREVTSPVAFEYQLPLPTDIDSGDGEALLPMSSKNLEGNFFYYAVPKQDPLVYLVCEANLAGVTLLPGQLNIHFSGRFVGNTFLDDKKAGESLLINLGAVRDVKIQRKKTIDQVAESLLSGVMDRFNVVRKLEFLIVVENLKTTDIQLRVIDAIPVAVTDRVQIKNITIKPVPDITDWQNRKGVMCWNFALPAKQIKEIRIQYLVKHPKNFTPEIV